MIKPRPEGPSNRTGGHDAEQAELDQLLVNVEKFSELLQAMTFELALLLARLKQDQPLHDIHRQEPRFLRLINGAVEIVKNVNSLTRAARETDPLVFDPPAGTTTALDQQLTEISRILNEIDLQLRHKAGGNQSDTYR